MDEKSGASVEKAGAIVDGVPAYRDTSSDSEDEILVTKDGIKLHPQPTADPLDPLNWSFLKKHVILGIVMLKYVPLPEKRERRGEGGVQLLIPVKQVFPLHLPDHDHRTVLPQNHGAVQY
jgi:hypothetical protein